MTKKILMFAAVGLVMFSGSDLFAARSNGVQHLDANGNGIYEEGEVDPCREYRCGPARCTYPVTKFKKKTYCTKRCVKEPYTVRKKCVRYKNEYYTKTYCRKVPETYYTCETKYRNKWVKDEHCCYEPYTVCKTECVDLNACSDCDQGGCSTGGCSTGGCASGSCSADSRSSASRGNSSMQETPISNARTSRSRQH